MYILQCANGLYNVGSTTHPKVRIGEHQAGMGERFTSKQLPAKLVYFEEFNTVAEAFEREQNVKGWGRKKKEALIYGFKKDLHDLSACKNDSHFEKVKARKLVESSDATDEQISDWCLR